MVRSQIRSLARQYSKYRLDLDALAERVGAYVIYTDMDPDIDGFTIRYPVKGSRYCCLLVVNGAVSHYRQRYTLAHEIGHILLGHKAGASIAGKSIRRTQEIQANIFASELLVPSSELRKAIEEGLHFYELSSYFQVSYSVIAIRLRQIHRADMIPPDCFFQQAPLNT